MLRRPVCRVLLVASVLLGLAVSPAVAQAADEELRIVARAEAEFGFELFRALGRPGENLALSPLVTFQGFSTLHMGAAGETKAQIGQALRWTETRAIDEGAIARLVDQLELSVVNSPDQSLALPSALWIQRGFRIRSEFRTRAWRLFYTDLRTVDFDRDAAGAVEKINGWVSEQTEGEIETLLEKADIKPLTRVILTTAVCFRGRWKLPFPRSATQPAPFHLDEDRSVDVPMMSATHRVKYTETEKIQLVELPYKGNGLAMVVLLPRERGALPSVERAVSADALDAWLREARTTSVEVSLPRFGFTATSELEPALRGLGIELAFTPFVADFSRIAGELYIDRVRQVASVKVDEVGTVAAAAEAVIMRQWGTNREQPSFLADHPFLFVIRDRQTGTILFIGRVVDPRS